MKANEKYLIRFLDSSDTNFVIPVYQRNYDWKKEQCKQLYDDLVNMIKYKYKNHFFGTIVSIYNDSGRNREYLIIDGQQRITTISILLLAIVNIIKENRLKANGIIKEKLTNQYLINQYCEDDDRKLKLKPIKNDRQAFEKLFYNEDFIEDSNITSNYKYFYNRIIDGDVSINELFEAIEKLMIVEIELKNGEDDPQLIFESLNSTGLDLTDADKVRNFILMGKSSKVQEKLYNKYWHKVEKNTEYKVTEFIRDYMTMKQNKIANISKIYANFKEYVITNGIDIEECLKDMIKFSEYYNNILRSNLGIRQVDEILKRINRLEVTVSYPFLLEVLDDYYNAIINDNQLIEIFEIIESYIFRRILCKIPTNALNKVFMSLSKEIKREENYKNNYVEALSFILTNKKASQRMPNDEEFKRNFFETDIYHWKGKNKIYLLERIENYDNNEKVDVEGLVESNILSVEHIMPQTLTNVWKELLGSNYQEIYNKYINTIGNLTLTGYNSSLSNKSFIEKRDMEKGFKESRLRLNNYLGSIDKWGEDEIVKRAEMLYDLSLEVWKYPEVQYVQECFKGNLFSLADDDDFTNSKVKQFSFLSDMIKITNWTRLYELVCLSIYDLEPVKFKRLAYKKFEEEYIKKRFATVESALRTPFKIADNLYIEKNLSTEAKLATLRVIFDECSIEYNELTFVIE